MDPVRNLGVISSGTKGPIGPRPRRFLAMLGHKLQTRWDLSI